MCKISFPCCRSCGQDFDIDGGAYLCKWNNGVPGEDYRVINDPDYVCPGNNRRADDWEQVDEPRLPLDDEEPRYICMACPALLRAWKAAGLEIVKAVPDASGVIDYTIDCDAGELSRKGLLWLNADLVDFMRKQLTTDARRNEMERILHEKADNGTDTFFRNILREVEMLRTQQGYEPIDDEVVTKEMVDYIDNEVRKSINKELQPLFEEMDRVVRDLIGT